MFSIIKRTDKIYKSKTAQNGFWLYILQIFNTVIPLITLPYITRILGPSQYGAFSSALNLVGYFQVIVQYGFDLSGTRKVAISKDRDKVSKIYSTITLSKLFLCLLTFIAMLLFSQIFNFSKVQYMSMLILYLMVFGTGIQQTWLFQGLQEMKYITLVSVISRTISVVLTFLLVNKSQHIYLYSGLYSLTYLLMGIVSILLIKYKFKIHFQKISAREIIIELKDGWYLFTTSAMTKLFGGIGITILTFTSSSNDVGVYSAIQKIPLLLIMMYSPISEVIFPHVSKKYLSSFEEGLTFIKKSSKYILSIVILISLTLIINSRLIVRMIYGEDYAVYSFLVPPLIIWVILSVLNNILGIQVLVASGHLREYSISFRIGVVAILLFNIILGSTHGMLGISIAALLAEMILTGAIIYHINGIIRKDNIKKK